MNKVVDLTKKIEEQIIVFLDLETTGLDVVTGDAICEIGAVKVKEGKIINKSHSLINPKKSVPAQAYQVHKISDEDLKGAPFFEKVAGDLSAFLEGSVICAYNVSFDMGFIDHHLKNMGSLPLMLPAIDALAMARDALKLNRYNLASVAQHFEIDCSGGLHRAMDDAMIVYYVFYKLIDILREKGLSRLDEFISIYGFNNDIVKVWQKQRLDLIKAAVEKEDHIRLKHFSVGKGIKNEKVMPLRILEENSHFYLLYQDQNENSGRIRSNRILEVESLTKD